jgi:hypothetical protein
MKGFVPELPVPPNIRRIKLRGGELRRACLYALFRLTSKGTSFVDADIGALRLGQSKWDSRLARADPCMRRTLDSGLARSIAERLLLTGPVRRAPFHYDCQLPRCPPSNGDTQQIRPIATIGLARIRTTLKPANIVVGARGLKATYAGNLGRGMMAKIRPSTTGHLPDPPVTQPETGAHPCRSRTPKAPAN